MDIKYQKVLDACVDVATKMKSGVYAGEVCDDGWKFFKRKKGCFFTDLKSIDREVISMMKDGSRDMLCRVVRECKLDGMDRLLLYFLYGVRHAGYHLGFPEGLEEYFGGGNAGLTEKFVKAYEKLRSFSIATIADKSAGSRTSSARYIVMEEDFYCLIRYNRPRLVKHGGMVPSPMEIHEYLSRWVIGQDRAKKALSVAASRHYLADGTKQMPRSNILIAGPTGSGKTYLAKKLADCLNVPIVFCSANEFTSSGYVGRNVGEIIISLLRKAGSREEAERGIVFIDEVDKIVAADSWAGLDVAGRRVQEEFLNIIESDMPTEFSSGGWPPEKAVFNARNVLFIAAGAFAGMEEIKRRVKKLSIGFGAGADARQERTYRPKTEDFIQYGLIPEFIGRFQNIITMHRLGREDMFKIMTSAQGSPVEKFNSLAAEYGAKLSFTENALYAIADEAVARGLGARGLQGILEEVLQDYLFNINLEENLPGNIIIDVETTRAGSRFKYDYRENRESENFPHDTSIFDIMRGKDMNAGGVPGGNPPMKQGNTSLNLNPEYTFENFVVSGKNQFAHAACLGVAEAPGKAYNPLLIYGGTGLGIPHLMQAVAWFIFGRRKIKPNIVRVSAGDFTDELIEATRKNNIPAFRQKYRSADLLLFEDIQFLSGNDSAQEEFFQTFNALYDSRKQIIISSDRPPKEIPALEERLVTRFDLGFITEIFPPDLEYRTAMLKVKCRTQNLAVPDEVITFIAEKIKSNESELEFALTKAVAYASANKKPLTLETAREALRDILPEEKPVTIELIQAKTADYFDLNLIDMKKKNRSKNVDLPRQIAMYLARELTQHSLSEIGKTFGGRDHLTIIHAHKKIGKGLGEDRNLARMVEELKQTICE